MNFVAMKTFECDYVTNRIEETVIVRWWVICICLHTPYINALKFKVLLSLNNLDTHLALQYFSMIEEIQR